MIEKLKSYLNYAVGLVILILGGILLNRNRKLQKTESELATAVAKNATQENDNDRAIAKTHADDLVKSYDELKHEYDENRTGGGS